MPSNVVNILIAKVDLLAVQMAALQTDMAWLKKTTVNSAETHTDMAWFKKAAYLVGGAALSMGANFLLK